MATKATTGNKGQKKEVNEPQHFEIVSDVLMPSVVQGRSKYPFELLEPGQSFFVGCTATKAKAMKANLSSAAKRVEKKESGTEFLCVVRTKKVDGEEGVRCWCVTRGPTTTTTITVPQPVKWTEQPDQETHVGTEPPSPMVVEGQEGQDDEQWEGDPPPQPKKTPFDALLNSEPKEE